MVRWIDLRISLRKSLSFCFFAQLTRLAGLCFYSLIITTCLSNFFETNYYFTSNGTVRLTKLICGSLSVGWCASKWLHLRVFWGGQTFFPQKTAIFEVNSNNSSWKRCPIAHTAQMWYGGSWAQPSGQDREKKTIHRVMVWGVQHISIIISRKNMRKIYGAMGSCKVPWPIGRKKEASSLMKPTRSGQW